MPEGTPFFGDEPILRVLAEMRQLARRELCKLPDCLASPGKSESGYRVEFTPFVLAGEIINRCKRLALVDGIKYERIGNEHYLRAGAIRAE